MKANTVGSIIESICGKCNDVMGHTIMAMVGEEIIKAECRACGSVHRYRAPARAAGGKTTVVMKKGRGGEPAVSRQAVMAEASRPAMPKGGARKRVSAACAAQEAWRTAMRRREGQAPRPYAMAESFAVGEFIEHPTFGNGEVVAVAAPDKMDVIFELGTKRLLCNKTQPGG